MTDPNHCACGNRKPINRAVCTECPEPEAVIDAALAKANASLDEAMRRSIDTVGGLREPTDREGDVAEGAD